jgi:hypothetical protein
MSMKEPSTYQAILEEGRQEGRSEGALAQLKKGLRLLGDSAFGVPDARTATAIERINDLAQLEDLLAFVARSGGDCCGTVGRRLLWHGLPTNVLITSGAYNEGMHS